MAEKEWDVFISHARGDKDSVARPLAKPLRKAAVRVWLDDHELMLGDSLSGKIDEGLAQSRFGVVILSPAFLMKHLPKEELSVLGAREEEGRKGCEQEGCEWLMFQVPMGVNVYVLC